MQFQYIIVVNLNAELRYTRSYISVTNQPTEVILRFFESQLYGEQQYQYPRSLKADLMTPKSDREDIKCDFSIRKYEIRHMGPTSATNSRHLPAFL